MTKPSSFHRRAALTGITGIAAAFIITFSAAVPAAADSSIPAGAQSCGSGQPKLDYEYENGSESGGGATAWSNVCGTGTWDWNIGSFSTQDWLLIAIRMPTTPYHRVWLHQGSNSLCLYSEDNDIYISGYDGGTWLQPDNVQVSANTSPC